MLKMFHYMKERWYYVVMIVWKLMTRNLEAETAGIIR